MNEAAVPTPRLPPAWVVPPLFRARSAVGRVHAVMAPPSFRVLETMFVLVEVHALHVVAELGLADAMAARPRTATQLAEICEANPDAIERLLRVLVARGHVRRAPGGCYRNGATTELLRADHPESLREWVRFVGSDWLGALFGAAPEAFRTGTAPAAATLGMNFFDWLSEHPEAASTFDGAMRQASRLTGPLLVQAHDFSGCERVCDVGGGTGMLLATVLAANTATRGVLFDLPSVAAKAPEVLQHWGVAERCEVVGGSFFDSVPEGCDRYLLQAIVHDWDDDPCSTILENVRRALPPHGRVLVLEMVVPDTDVDRPVKYLDLVMLLTGGGRERTDAQYRTLFDRAGLRLERAVALPTTQTLMELAPA